MGFVFSAVLLALGCQQARLSGHDPLLGKMRVDPPATSARSVYVERRNVQDSGLLPSDTEAIVNAPAGTAAKKKDSGRSETVQTASEQRVTVHKVPVQPVDETVSETGSGASPEEDASRSVNSSHLRWKTVDVFETAPAAKDPERRSFREDVRKPAAEARELTEEELAYYRYAYDFSTIPPRKVPLESFGQEPFSVPQDDEIVPAQGMIGLPVRVPEQNFYGNDFDPYASHHEFDLKRLEVSRRFEMEFDARDAEKTQKETLSAGETAAAARSLGETVGEPAAVDPATRADGWKIVSARGNFDSAGIASEMKTAPIQKRLGNQVQIGQGKAASNSGISRKTGPTSFSGAKRGASVELLDLPK